MGINDTQPVQFVVKNSPDFPNQGPNQIFVPFDGGSMKQIL